MTYKITFRTGDHIAQIWRGYASYGDAMSALRDADLKAASRLRISRH
jgi:hypothetical protein